MGGEDSVVFSLCVKDWEKGIQSDVVEVMNRKWITESTVSGLPSAAQVVAEAR